MISYIQEIYIIEPLFFYVLIFVLSAFIGSFLNVVIFRLPIIMKLEERNYINQHNKEHSKKIIRLLNEPNKKFATLNGRSYCPICNTKIPFWNNIPIISWFILMGKTACCKNKYSFRYPFIEAITATLSLALFFIFDIKEACWLLPCLWASISMYYIDIDEYLLPDSLVFLCLWLGMLASIDSINISSELAIKGAIFGYVSLYSLTKLHSFIRGNSYLGMGHGDFKIAAAIGAWCGINALLYVFIVATIFTIIIAIFYFIKCKFSNKLPFGPGLICGWWLIMTMNKINLISRFIIANPD